MATGEGTIGSQMAASYVVEITGIPRTRRELKTLTGAIQELRRGNYSPYSSTTVASSLGVKDLLVTKLDELEGRVQKAAEKAMIAAMNEGRDRQATELRAATTTTGLSGRSHTKGPRNGPGRDDTGAMIKALKRSVEVLRTAGTTVITGWHGWGLDEDGKRLLYYPAQEKGSIRGVPAANSLGKTIIPVREFLKKELKGLKR